MQKRHYYIFLMVMSAALALTGFFSLHIGTVSVPFSATVSGFLPDAQGGFSGEELATFRTVVMQIRLPRLLAAVLCGAALAISGVTYQSMFLNPLVSPDLLGVLAGSAFGASLGLLFGKSLLTAHLFAFIAGIIAVGFAVFLARLFPGNRLIMLIMGGVISSSLFTSLLSVVKFIADPHNELPAIVHWLMGGFSSVTMPAVAAAAPFLIIGIALLNAMSGYLNILSMGEEEAATLGIKVSTVRNLMIAVTTMICSITVALGGMVGWVGLMIPHITRMITGPDNRQVLPAATLVGALYLLITDIFCRAAFSTELPIGIMTSLMGVPFFIFVLSRTSGRWN